ncbi:MAG TPA: acyl-CoA dehydrogenase C-terminal domain-containing protein [Burkholderiales bacterium]|jgi:butyryl-CoA dehydrogenase|nr:acyl-CoA dehydrogenase C-terminal domain-containing protein [Burkholderiales bacterium]
MAAYRAPLRDMRFVLHELHQFEELRSLPGCGEFSADVIESVLDAAARLSEKVLQRLNRAGDEQGCRLSEGAVRAPAGFREAYRAYAAGGWASLACDPEFGGQGLPHAVRILVEETICSANLAFASYTMLVQGAYRTLLAHASEPLKRRYLPRLVSGEWTATMCLTEAHSGSDLGLVRTRARADGDGSYRISGTKIFISAGDHDLAGNIVHLVLARLTDAPGGSQGISLFVVPKVLADSSGELTTRNRVSCVSLENKMGQKACATCVLAFDDAAGWMIGEPNRGLNAMFAMINTARMGAAIQGLGIAEAAYQGASHYARERLQGRSLAGVRYPDKPADPIIVHADVRRMLLTMRAHVEGMRALAQWVAQAFDRGERHPDQAIRHEAGEFVALMTPVLKAMFSDLGSECANLGIQVYGGHGYIREHGMEQYVRDIRIAQIYDGTNGIQALDLVRRKIGAGGLAHRFFEPVQHFFDASGADPSMTEFVQPLSEAFARLQQVTGWISRAAHADPEEAASVATEYLRLFGLVALAFMWAKMAAVALPRTDGPEAAFYRAKLGTARFFLQRLFPQEEALVKSILAGGRSLHDFDEAAF